jgi:AcrR family transcriptional regulator
MSKAASDISSEKQEKSPAKLWKTQEIRSMERTQKRMAVLLTAAKMFLERGSHRVAMTDISDELGITKPALYNYFRSKDEILFECFRQSNLAIVEQLDAIERRDENGLTQLRAFILAYIRLVTVDYGSVMIRLEDRELPTQYRDQVRQYKRAIDSRFRAILVKGANDGTIVQCNVKLTTFAILGALNWTGQWFRNTGGDSVDHVGNEFVAYLTNGLAIPCGTSRPSTSDTITG